MAENMTGILSSSWGVSLQIRLPCASRSNLSGFLPRKTFVSIGSRRGSMEGFVTWDALIRILSQYTGNSLGLPMEESSTPPEFACL